MKAYRFSAVCCDVRGNRRVITGEYTSAHAMREELEADGYIVIAVWRSGI